MQEESSLINFNEAFNYGFETTKKKWPILLGISFLIIFISLSFEMINFIFAKNFLFMTRGEIFFCFLLSFFSFLMLAILQYNSFKICLDILNKKKTSLWNLFNLPEINTVKFLFGSFLYGILVFFSFLVFIIPGVYFSLRYAFVPTLIIDKKLPITKAFKESARMTSGVKWQLLAYFLILSFVCLLMIFAGLFAFLVGVIPAIFFVVWICTFANLQVYKKLL